MSAEDLAQERELREWEANNSRPVAPTYRPGDPQYGTPYCEDCDLAMPEARRAMGKCLCTTCQERAEHVNRMYRRH